MNIFTIERSNKRGVELRKNPVRDRVTLVFQIMDLADKGFYVMGVFLNRNFFEQYCRLYNVAGRFFKQRKELVVLRQQFLDELIKFHCPSWCVFFAAAKVQIKWSDYNFF